MAPDDLSEEDLGDVAGGITQDTKKSNAIAEMIYGPANRSDDNGIRILCKNDGLGIIHIAKGNAKSSSADAGPIEDHSGILW